MVQIMDVCAADETQDADSEPYKPCGGSLPCTEHPPESGYGVALISTERDRQRALGWSTDHDLTHSDHWLALEASRRIIAGLDGLLGEGSTHIAQQTYERALAQAGALLAAELDRLLFAALIAVCRFCGRPIDKHCPVCRCCEYEPATFSPEENVTMPPWCYNCDEACTC